MMIHECSADLAILLAATERVKREFGGEMLLAAGDG